MAESVSSLQLQVNKNVPLSDPRFRTHNQNMTVAARAMADRNTLGQATLPHAANDNTFFALSGSAPNLFQKLFGLNRIEVVDAGYERQITQPSAAQISEPPAPRELKDLLRETYRFVAVDVETANRNHSSICQIGMALVSADGTIDTIGILIDPEQHFENFNVDLHGIDDDDVRGALTFELALQSLRARFKTI